jgi:antitoxin MazE
MSAIAVGHACPASNARRFGLRSGDTVDAQVTLDAALTIRTGRWNRGTFAAELEQARTMLPAGTPVVAELRRDARY